MGEMSIAQILVFFSIVLVLLIGVVSPFLWYLSVRDKRATIAETARIDQIKEIGSACHAFQRDMNAKNAEAFRAVVDALNKNSEALIRNSEALRQFESRGNQNGRAAT